jgi:molybdopterin synthase catalytic subunit
MPNPAEVAEACDAARDFLKAEKSIAKQGYRWNGEKYVKDAQ